MPAMLHSARLRSFFWNPLDLGIGELQERRVTTKDEARLRQPPLVPAIDTTHSYKGTRPLLPRPHLSAPSGHQNITKR